MMSVDRFFHLVQTKTPGSRKNDHYHVKRHSKPQNSSYKTPKTRSLNTVAIAETQDLRFLNLKDFFNSESLRRTRITIRKVFLSDIYSTIIVESVR